jgi:hypothetical protein
LSSVINSCIKGAEVGFGFSSLVEGGVILATGDFPPAGIAVGGLLAGAFLGCLAFSYFSKPYQPIQTSSVAELINEDEAQFTDVVREFADLYDAVINTTNNFNVDITPALKYDLLWILALDYNDYYAYIGSVQSYQNYIINNITQSFNPYIQNIIYSAQAYAQTISYITSISGQTGSVQYSTNISNVQPIVIYPLGNFGDLNYIPYPVGFGIQYQAFNTTNTLVVLFADPTQTYVAYNPNTNKYTTITFNTVVVEQVPLGLADILPFVLAEQYASNNGIGVVTIEGINAQINGGSVEIAESMEPASINLAGNNVAVLINLNQTANPAMYISTPNGYTGSYLNFGGIIQYLQFLQNLNLTLYAQDLYNYYHNMGYTQAQLYNLLKGTAFNIYFPNCNPSAVYQESQLLFTILNDLYQQGNTANINVFPIFAGGSFSVNGQTIQGYAQFNTSVVLQSGQCTSVGGILVDLNNNVYYIPPGNPICNASQNTIVFRPDIWKPINSNTCNFVPIPFDVLGINNAPQNTSGIILDLNYTTTFTVNQQYTQQGWYVNSALDSYNNTPTGIAFTPQFTFEYIPYNQAYLTINNSGLQTTQNSVKGIPNNNAILWIIAILLLGGVLGAILYKKTHSQYKS